MNRREFLGLLAGGIVGASLFKTTPVQAKGLHRYFRDFEEMDAYIELYRTGEKTLPVVLVASSSGVVSFDSEYDCDDYARAFVMSLLDEGIITYEVPVKYGILYSKTVTSHRPAHAGNLIRAGNAYYYLETSPGPDRWKLVKVTNID